MVRLMFSVRLRLKVCVFVCRRRRMTIGAGIRVTPVSHAIIELLVMFIVLSSTSSVLSAPLISRIPFLPFHVPLSAWIPCSPPAFPLPLAPCSLVSSEPPDLANPLQISLQQMVLCLHWARSPSNPVSLHLSFLNRSSGGVGVMHCLGLPCPPLFCLSN